MALSRAVSEIFNVEKCRDLEIGVRGHSRSLKVVPFGTSCIYKIQYKIKTYNAPYVTGVIRRRGTQIQNGFLLVFFSNFVPKTHRF